MKEKVLEKTNAVMVSNIGKTVKVCEGKALFVLDSDNCFRNYVAKVAQS